MTYLDYLMTLEPTSGSAITATRYTENVLDLQGGLTGNTANRDIARGKDIYALFTVITAAGASDAGTLELQVVNAPHDTEAEMSKTNCALTIATDLVTWASHGLPIGTPVAFSSIATTTGLSTVRHYFVSANNYSSGSFTVAETYEAALNVSGAVVNLATGDGSATVTAIPHILASSGPLTPTLLTAGTQIALCLNKPLNHAVSSSKIYALPTYRYLAGRFVETGTITTAVVKCELIEGEPDGLKFYPGGWTIS